MRKCAILLILFLLFNTNIFSQHFNEKKLDSLFSLIENTQKGMGSISIFKNGKEVFQKSFGYADLENKILINPYTKFRIGSISKTFTATLVMQLIEEGKLSLDTKLSNYFPEIPNASEITLEQLLRHRSGLFNFTNAKDFIEWSKNPKSREELVQLIIHHGTTFKPNEKAEYSNTNYVLLSLIMEKVENKNYSEIINDRLIKPLHLKNTYYGNSINPKRNEAHSYWLNKTWEKASQTDMSIPLGAGAIVSTPTDLNIFYHSLFSNKCISTNSIKEMKNIIDNFGIGMIAIPFYDKVSFGHSGAIDGFQSMISYFPDDSLSIAYISNAISWPVNDILIGALSIYFGKNYSLKDLSIILKINEEDLKKYLGTYSASNFPLKLTISNSGNQLIGQATGQPSFPLDPYARDKFKFDQAMIKIEFLPDQGKLILKQGGMEFMFTRD